MKTLITDFRFEFAGYGHYRVTYTSPISGKQWSTVISNMGLIDSTKNADKPRQRDINLLKNLCKNN